MRVLVWNMNKRRVAWDYIERNTAHFDVALLQEAHEPVSNLQLAWRSAIWRPYSRDPSSRLAHWGTAVVAPHLELDAYEPTDELRGRASSGAWTRYSGRPTSCPSTFL